MTRTLNEKLNECRALLEGPKEPLEMLTILKDAEAYAKRIAPKNVRVTRSQKDIYFSIDGDKAADKAAMLDVKKKVTAYLLPKYKHRKLLHAKSKGYKVWWWQGTSNWIKGLRCGITVKLLPDELNSILLGPVKGVNA